VRKKPETAGKGQDMTGLKNSPNRRRNRVQVLVNGAHEPGVHGCGGEEKEVVPVWCDEKTGTGVSRIGLDTMMQIAGISVGFDDDYFTIP
jgi:hypothetical protein